MSTAITREQVLALLEAVTRERKALKVPSTARSKGGHDELVRAVATRLTEALRESGFAWAKVPTHGDLLYRILVEAVDNAGGEARFGISSDDESVRLFSRHAMADQIMSYLARTNTAVVKRKAGS